MTMTTSPATSCFGCRKEEGSFVLPGQIYENGCERKLCGSDCKFVDESLTAKECLVTRLEQIYTFDNLDFNYDLCSHLITKDCIDGEFEIILRQDCSNNSTCTHVVEAKIHGVSIQFQQNSRQFKVNGYEYNMESISALNNNLLEQQGVQIENYGFGMAILGDEIQVNYELNGDLKVHIGKKYFTKTCGMCGNANCIKEDDALELAGSSSKPPPSFAVGEQNCTPEVNECPIDMKDDIADVCANLEHNIFSDCHKEISLVTYKQLCNKEACDCLKSGKSVQECSCRILSHYVESCQKFTGECSALGWREEHQCPSPSCPAGKIYRDCGNACPRSCADILKETVDCPVEYTQPGCFCPEGYITEGDRCIKEDECKCVCRGWGDPHYQTYDKRYFPFQGDCTYILSRPKSTWDFVIYGHNEFCFNNPTTTCTKAITVKFNDHVVTLLEGLTFIANGNMTVQNSEKTIIDDGLIVIEQYYGRHLLLTIEQIQLQIMYDQLTMGFAISVPVITYHEKLEGLCGDCNYNKTNDNIDPNGDPIYETDRFVDSWKVVNKCVNDDDILCNKCADATTTTPFSTIKATTSRKTTTGATTTIGTSTTPSECEQKCDILDSDIFAACRQVVDFTPYKQSCIYDACKDMKPCFSIAAAAEQCREAGICVDWRSEIDEDCDVQCPAGREYKHCSSSCDTGAPMTCNDVIGNNTTSTGLCILSETCACPEGMVDHEGECIKPTECPSCLEKYPEGATWKDEVDPCVEYICENSSVRSIEYRCDTQIPNCGQYEKLVANTTEECCTRYECECDQENCPAAPTCAEGEYFSRQLNFTKISFSGEVLKSLGIKGCCEEYYCASASCDVVTKLEVLHVEDCDTVIPVNVTYCEGSCASSTSIMETFSEAVTERACTCCTGIEFDTKNVELMCPGGFQVSHQHKIVTKCQCNASQCGAP